MRGNRPSIVHLVVVLIVGTVVAGGLPSAPSAQVPNQDGQSAEQKKHPRPNNADRSKNLDFLFGALKAAPDPETAKAVETRILALWQVSGSDTTDLLMARAKKAMDGKDLKLAIQLLDGVVEIRPEFVEAWNRRATLHFLNKDFGAALEDIRQVLGREPRHFGALVGLGMILQELGEDKMALTALRRALELHPHLPRISEQVKALEEKVEGRAI